MTKQLLLFSMVGIMAIFTSCSSMYIPSMGIAPLLKEQGEIVGEANISTNALQLGSSYAITNHIAGMANMNLSMGNFSNNYDIYTSKDKDSSALADLTHYGKFNNRYYEAGIGYYDMFNKEHFKMEAFGGVGFSHATDKDDSNNKDMQTYDSKYVSIFGQVNAGYVSKYCDFGLALRFVPSFHTYYWTNEIFSPSTKTSGTEEFSMMHIEPLLFLRVGSPTVKFVAKAGVSFPFYSTAYEDARENIIPNSNYMGSTIMHFSMGVNVTIPTNNNNIKQ